MHSISDDVATIVKEQAGALGLLGTLIPGLDKDKNAIVGAILLASHRAEASQKKLLAELVGIAELLLEIQQGQTGNTKLTEAAGKLKEKSDGLQAALDNDKKLSTSFVSRTSEGNVMPADLQPTIDIMTNADTVMDSAVAFIGQVPGLITTAVNQAIAGGVTAAQLQPVVDLGVAMKTKADALAAALTANTPQPPPTTDQLKKARGGK